MTNVINFSLFNLNLGGSTLDDFRYASGHSDKNHDRYFQNDRVIDVTPESTVINKNEIDRNHSNENIEKLRRLRGRSVNVTYDRHGRIVNYFHAKGVYLNSYA